MKKWIAVFKTDGQYGKKGDTKIMDREFESKEDVYAGNASDFGNHDVVDYVEVPEGKDPRHVAVEHNEGQHASAEYEGVNYVSSGESSSANQIILEFNGEDSIRDVVNAWNEANPGNSVGQDAEDDEVVPSAGTVQLSGGSTHGYSLVDDQDKIDAANSEDAATTIGEKYQTMRDEVYAEMEEKFGTRSLDSGDAYKTTWERMSANPSAYMGIAYKADIDTATFSKGDVLDTETKLENFANEALDKVDAFLIFRKNKLETFRDEREALLNP